MKRLNSKSPRMRWLSAVLSMIAILPAWAQVNLDAYRDYFLVGQFGEVCTMCEVVVLCEAAETIPTYTNIPEAGAFTLYYLQTRSFWSQITTIWEWFIANFKADSLASRGHARPVYVYTIENSAWSAPEIIEGRLILEPGLIELANRNIDRVDQGWLSADSSDTVGYCQRMPLWDALDVIDRHVLEGGQP